MMYGAKNDRKRMKSRDKAKKEKNHKNHEKPDN